MHTFGASLATTDGDALVPEFLSSASASSFDGALWWRGAWEDVSLQLSLGVAAQDINGALTAGAGAPPALAGQTFPVSGDVDTTSFSATLARTFGDGIIFTPSLSVGYAMTDVSISAGAAGGVAIDTESEGATASLDFHVSGPIGEMFSWSAGGGLIAAEDQSARTLAVARAERFRPLTRQAGGSASWSEVYLGLSAYPSDTLALSASIGSTMGLDFEERWASMTATILF
jgi:hypothetical protein